MFTKVAKSVHKICNKIPQLNFRHRLVFQQPVDFPVDTVYPFRYLLQRAADIAQAQEMLRAAGQNEYGSRHELDALQAQPLPEQSGVHIRSVRQQRNGHNPRTGPLETVQRDGIAWVFGEHDCVLTNKRLT